MPVNALKTEGKSNVTNLQWVTQLCQLDQFAEDWAETRLEHSGLYEVQIPPFSDDTQSVNQEARAEIV